jgi:O-antigen/teichoic acid export membrane protein
MRLSIILPAHNEEARIGRMLDAYLPFFAARYGSDVELIVVVNGSTDRTEDVVAGYARRYPILRQIVEPRPVGKGGALILGFEAAAGDLIGYVDSDGATPPEAFQDLVDRLGDASGIIASRWCRGAEVSPRQPLVRRITSRVFNLMTRVLFGLRLTDTQCGAKLLRRKPLLDVLPRLGITRWAFDVDLLFQLKRAGYAVTETPTVWHDVEGSKVQVGRTSMEMTLALARLRLLYSPLRWVVSLYDRFVVPWVHPEGLERDHLLRHSLVLLAGTQLGAICNLAFQVIMVRMLSVGDYGVLAAMLGIAAILGMPLGALSGAVTHFTAHFMADKQADKVKAMLLGLCRDLLAPSLLLLALTALGYPWLATFFRLDTPVPLFLTVVAMMLGIYSALATGVLMGWQAFGWVAVLSNSWGVLRLLFGVLFVAAGGAVAGALTGQLVGALLGTVLSFAVCGRLLTRGWPRGERPVGMYAYMGRYMAAFAGLAVLSNADMVLVKHYFDPEQAGAFAKAAMAARIIFFLPQPIAAAMFPKVTSAGEASYASWRTLSKALVLVGLMVVGIGLFCTVFPVWVLQILAGTRDPALVPVLRGMIWALAPVTLVTVLLNYELAQRRFIVTVPLVACAAAYVAGVARWHATVLEVVGVLGAVGTVSLVLVLACLPWREMRKKS